MPEKKLNPTQHTTKKTSDKVHEVPDPVATYEELIHEGSEGAAPRTDYAREERDQFGRTISDDDDYFQESLGQSQIKTRNMSLEAIEEELEDDEDDEELEDDDYQES